MLRKLIAKIPFNVSFHHSRETSSLARQVINALNNIYYGIEDASLFPLAMKHLRSHVKKALEAVMQVPIGYITTYGSVARAVEASPRTVGRAMALNPFILIVPCHRVVYSDLSLGGYGEGLNVKMEILTRECRSRKTELEIQFNGKNIHAFPVESLLSKYTRKNCNS
ncbi:MAG: MGMT family protein [Nitrososphaerota archaeon]|nr:MGMT family protein [Candidatus Bathyarchaeota archaeon]MDW8193775.1 MGMT family protein [Nitrososphaerota archaeon]